MLQISAYSTEKIYRKSILHEGNQNLANTLYLIRLGRHFFSQYDLKIFFETDKIRDATVRLTVKPVNIR